MEDTIYLTRLFDYYGSLLTEKEQLYFKGYYFDNLTLQEMSENYHVSRNAIHKEIMIATKKLNNYEDKLQLYAKNKRINVIINDIDKNKKEKIQELI